MSLIRGRRVQEVVHVNGATFALDNVAAATGQRVTPENAMRYGAVFACVRAVTETIATLPKHVYLRTGQRRQQVDAKHPAHGLIYRAPNPEQTDVEFWEMMLAHLELRGNASAEIEIAGGNPVGLWPLHPDRVGVKRRAGGGLLYEILAPNGQHVVLPSRQVLHLRMLSTDGLVGLSQVAAAAQSIGLSLAAQQYGGKVFAGGGTARQALVSDQPLRKEQLDDYRRAWQESYGGLTNAHRVAVLGSGLKPHQIGVSPEDAQLLELLSAGVTDICRIFRVPPHKIAQLDKATFSNIEEQNIDWVTDSILPRTVRIEKRLNESLLNADPDRFVKFNLDGLLRGDYRSRMEGHQLAILNGIKSPNECRDDEDLDPYEGGDAFRVPLNTGEVGGEDETGVEADGDAESAGKNTDAHGETRTGTEHPPYPPAGGGDKSGAELRASRALEQNALRDAFVPILTAAYRRVIKREWGEAVKAVERTLGARSYADFNDWMLGYLLDMPEWMVPVLSPGLRGLADAVAAQAAGQVGGAIPAGMDALAGQLVNGATDKHVKWFGERLEAIKAKYGPEYTIDMMRAEAAKYEEEMAQFLGERDAVFADGDIRRATYKENGVTKLVWFAGGSDTCPLCAELDGKVVGIEVDFAEGVQFPNGFTAGSRIFHPPLHDGCVCSVVPE
jgi:HK97 family phage portal protein